MLRRYRDDHLTKTESGRAEIVQYYARAPAIPAAMERRPDAKRRLLKLYTFVILPCALLVRIGRHDVAHRLYQRSFRRLMREHGS